jgi:hypothetical protein
MNNNVATLIASIMSVIATVVMGIISWGLRAQLSQLRTEFQLSLSNAEIRFFDAINGKYVRKDLLDEKLKNLPNCSACAERHRDLLAVMRAES